MSEYNCPFCETEVSEQLALYGGRCPTCFGDIPGEEAATDPGEAVKQIQAAEDARRTKMKVYAPILFSLPIIVGLVSFTAYTLMKPEPELEVMDLDAIEFSMPEMDMLIVAADEPTEDAAEKSQKSRSSKRRSKVGERRVKLGDTANSGGDEKGMLDALGGDEEPSGDGLRGPRRAGTADAMPEFLGSTGGERMQTGLKTDGSTLGSVSVGVGQTRLTNAKQIQQMVIRVLQRQLPALGTCYESRLRADSSLSGKWTLYFTVTSEGRAGKPRAVGQSMKDELLETCLVNKMNKWRFQPIKGTVPFKKTVTFNRR